MNNFELFSGILNNNKHLICLSHFNSVYISLFWSIWVYLSQSQSIKVYLRLSRTISNFLVLSQAISGYNIEQYWLQVLYFSNYLWLYLAVTKVIRLSLSRFKYQGASRSKIEEAIAIRDFTHFSSNFFLYCICKL